MPTMQALEREGWQMAKWRCVVCGYVYDEDEGSPADGIAPGTAWADVPDDWTCFDCGAPKSDFQIVDYEW